MSNFDDTNSVARQILGLFGGGVDESKRLVEFEDPEDELLAKEEESDPSLDEPKEEAEPFGDMESSMEPEEEESLSNGSMLDRMADLAADADSLSADLASIATQIGGGEGGGMMDEMPIIEMTEAENEEIDVAMIDDIQFRIDSIAESLEALRRSSGGL